MQKSGCGAGRVIGTKYGTDAGNMATTSGIKFWEPLRRDAAKGEEGNGRDGAGTCQG